MLSDRPKLNLSWDKLERVWRTLELYTEQEIKTIHDHTVAAEIEYDDQYRVFINFKVADPIRFHYEDVQYEVNSYEIKDPRINLKDIYKNKYFDFADTWHYTHQEVAEALEEMLSDFIMIRTVFSPEWSL